MSFTLLTMFCCVLHAVADEALVQGICHGDQTGYVSCCTRRLPMHPIAGFSGDVEHPAAPAPDNTRHSDGNLAERAGLHSSYVNLTNSPHSTTVGIAAAFGNCLKLPNSDSVLSARSTLTVILSNISLNSW